MRKLYTRTIHIVYILATLVLFLSTADAATYYVKVGGNNASAGTDWSTAWEHPNYTNGNISAGDSVIFAAGAYDTVQIRPPRGGTAKTVYACTSSVPSATFLSSGQPLSTNTSDWTAFSGQIYSYDFTIGDRWNAWLPNGDPEVCLTQNGRILDNQTSTGAMYEGSIYFNKTTNVLYVWADGGGNPAGYTMRYSQAPAVLFYYDDQDSITFSGMTFDMGIQGVVVLASSDHVESSASNATEFINCIIQNGSSAQPAFNQALIYSGNPGIATDANLGKGLRIINDTLRYCQSPNGGVAEHEGVGALLYSQEEVKCSNSVFIDITGACLTLKNGYNASVDVDDCVIMDNKFIGAQVAFRIGGHTDSLIVAGNQFINQTYRGFSATTSEGTAYSYKRIKVLNNTFYNINEPIVISPTAEDVGSGCEILYNVVFDTTSRGYSILFDVQGGEAPAQTPFTETFWRVDSNMYYPGSDTFLASFTDNNTTCVGTDNAGIFETGWDDWQACGFDANGLNSTNPNFAASQTPTLTRPSASGEMNYTYLGRTWEIFGALQNDATPCADTLVAPILETPANGATGQQNSVILDWSDSTQVGTVDVYDLQVDNNSDFSSLTFSSSPTDSRDTVTTELAHLTTYYWRVRSRSDCDTSAWSDSRTFVVDNYTWVMPAQRDNPLNAVLDSNSTLDDHGAILVGMDAATPADGDTLTIQAGWKCIIWSADAPAAKLVKDYDSTVQLIIYSSIDHGLHTIARDIDTTAPYNSWSDTADEYSHHRKICNDSSKSYYSLFYHFSEDTKILLSPRSSGGYTYYDTVFFTGATLPISDDDSSSVVPDSYTGPYFTGGTLDTLTVDTTSTNIYRRFNYQGTPQGSKFTRVYLDFSNPLARYVERTYVTRAFADNYDNLGGTGNDVYGWSPMSDAGYHWDGIFLDNSSDQSNYSPEGCTIISGGLIRGSTGVLGIWNADSTRNKINSHAKIYFAYLTDFCNDGTNFADGKAKITAANFGAWNENLSTRNPITQWYNDSNRINLKVLEFSRWDGGYSTEAAYETGTTSTTLGRSMAQQYQMDSLAVANDFYVMFGGRIDYQDTTTSTGWLDMKSAYLRSNWARIKTAYGHRGIFAPQPLIATATPTGVYRPCSNSSGVGYAGLNYTPLCNDRAEVDTFVNLVTLPFIREYDIGTKIADSSVTLTLTDGTAQTVSVYKTFWRDVVGTDTTYSWMYYFPRKLSTWEWRPSGLHYVLINPPPVNFKRLEYDGTLTTISGDAQTCYIGDQLILSYSTAVPYVESPMNTINGTSLQGVTIK